MHDVKATVRGGRRGKENAPVRVAVGFTPTMLAVIHAIMFVSFPSCARKEWSTAPRRGREKERSVSEERCREARRALIGSSINLCYRSVSLYGARIDLVKIFVGRNS